MTNGPAFNNLVASRRVIVFADLVESVRLYQQHEARTIERWRRFAIFARDRLAPARAGRLVRTAGDGLLLEFETTAAAIATAFALHHSLREMNDGEAADEVMLLRIGLHVAEVLADERELWGSGVNLAARLAALAQPGQTVASVELRSEVDDGVQADIEDLGLRYMKHLTEPVRCFLLRPPGEEKPSSRSAVADDLRPVVAVIPFVAMPADREHDALGHAVADDVIASLSRHPGLRVLSRASTAVLRDCQLELPRLRALLGASFMLSGRFYVRGSRVRLTAELCELEGGEVLWAGGSTAEINALFDGEDELVPHLVAQITQQVMARELSRVRSLPMSSLASYSLLLGANGLLNSLVPADFDRSREVLLHLAERHPRQAAPSALLASWHSLRVLQGWTTDPVHEGAQALHLARHAVETDPQQPGALVAEGLAHVIAERDFDTAGARFRQALAIDPGHASAWAHLSEVQTEAGAHEESLQSIARAISFSPLDPQRFIFEAFAARACYVIGRYASAVEHGRAAVRRRAMHAPAHRFLIAALWMSGEQAAARAAAADFLRLMPNARVRDSPRSTTAGQDADPAVGPFAQALCAAGVPL
jgi:adenylate cyclase